jgi:transcriptional regulator with XRE-family HTH domain
VAPPFGIVLRQARRIRGLSAVAASRAAGISAAYLSKLENDSVKRPSPMILHRLSEVLAVPYAELMRLNGYLVPVGTGPSGPGALAPALFGDLTDEERDELFEYLAWYRARRRTSFRRTRMGSPA